MTRGVLGYMVDASSRLSKHALSYDRLGRATEHTFGSDNAGNTHRMRWQYSYDDSNAGRLTAIASSNDDGLSSGSTATATYDYNPSGDRVKRVEGAVTKLWSYDGHNIATAESSDNANVYSVCTVLDGVISNAVARHDVNTASNSTTSYYYQYNHRGDVAAALDSGGGYLYKYEYDAYGNVTTKWNSAGGDAPTDGILMTGKDYDEDTRLYYFNARWYDPEVGRFVSATGMIPADEQRYSTCEDNPVNRVDQTGLLSLAGIGGEIRDIGRGIGRGIGDIGRGIGRGVGAAAESANQYGNCCGTGPYQRCDCYSPTIDKVDECCKEHDMCYTARVGGKRRWIPLHPGKAKCDIDFCLCLAQSGGPGSGVGAYGQTYALAAMQVFCSGLNVVR